ncbi:MAG: hypothetical protein ACQESP_10815, partial [Candidatus Muiribacteriota bacterium]
MGQSIYIRIKNNIYNLLFKKNKVYYTDKNLQVNRFLFLFSLLVVAVTSVFFLLTLFNPEIALVKTTYILTLTGVLAI